MIKPAGTLAKIPYVMTGSGCTKALEGKFLSMMQEGLTESFSGIEQSLDTFQVSKFRILLKYLGQS